MRAQQYNLQLDLLTTKMFQTVFMKLFNFALKRKEFLLLLTFEDAEVVVDMLSTILCLRADLT